MLGRTGTLAGARFAFTDRLDGCSAPPYDALNLADHVGDAPDAVAANRRRLGDALGLAPDRLAFMTQVHGPDVAEVTGAQPVPEADALVTTTPGLALVVLVADCVPVLLSGETVVAAAHAGRRGVETGVVPAAVEALRARGARRVSAVVGPAVCAACYEVPPELADRVVAVASAARATSRTGTPALDLRAGVVAQLAAAGVQDVSVDLRCTREDPSLFSHRRDGVTGRFAGVVVLP